MAKIADKYYISDPWNIIEQDFNPEYSQVSESIFSLGNEFMGVRGYFEEGYTGKSLIGNYFNGIYEASPIPPSGYKGIIDKTEFIVNAVDWLYLRIEVDGECVDLNQSHFKDFYRSLNLQTGMLNRSYTWILKDGRELRLEFERFVSMKNAHMAGQKISMTPLNFSGEIMVTAGLDFTQIHHMVGKNLWNITRTNDGDRWLSIQADTLTTNQSLYSSCYFEGNPEKEVGILEEKKVLKQLTFKLEEQKATILKRVVCNLSKNDNYEGDSDTFNVQCMEAERSLFQYTYEQIKEETTAWWEESWKGSDIAIDGDELNQQGIRYCIFQMHQTYHGAQKGSVIGAKGLTGEAYSGNTFWDTETYCLPFYIFHNLEAAKQLLQFRYLTLHEAKLRAKALDCKGAFYPIATISGRECCSLWQHASLQLQASTAVAYGIWHYAMITKDDDFVLETGLPILIEVSRMLATRGDWSEDQSSFGYYGVMGPDEFQMMVNNNCYTNYMGKFTLEYTLDVLDKLKQKKKTAYQEFLKSHDIEDEEIQKWSIIAKEMFIPYKEENKIFEQHEGYFKLPNIDIDKIPVEDFPLYHHWSYDRIYRNNMIKQPDVLMMMLLLNSSFTIEQVRNNYEYYEPRCIHESSLSPSVHSILAVQLKKHEEAYKFFEFATRMDLDNYNRNTCEGLHITSIAAAWMNIVYGFGGMRSDCDQLSFSPSIPKKWGGYSFRIHYQNDILQVSVDKEKAYFQSMHGTELNILVYGQVVVIKDQKIEVEILQEWRG
jgi:maltose phosphorylase